MSRHTSPQIPSFPTAPLPADPLAPYLRQHLYDVGDPMRMHLDGLERRVAELENALTRLQPAVEEVAGDSRNWFEVLWTV